MDLVQTDQLLTLAGFFAVLGLLWLATRFWQAPVAARLQGNRRIRLGEVTSLSPADRAMILNVDGQDFLLLRLKGAPAILQPLDTAAGAPADIPARALAPHPLPTEVGQ